MISGFGRRRGGITHNQRSKHASRHVCSRYARPSAVRRRDHEYRRTFAIRPTGSRRGASFPPHPVTRIYRRRFGLTADCQAPVQNRTVCFDRAPPIGAARQRQYEVSRSRNVGGSINFSVTFVSVAYGLLKKGVGMTDTAGIPGDRICAFIERVERIDEEIKALNEGKKEVFTEAKGEGFDVKVLKEILRLRKQDKDERDEQESLLDLYLRAMESAGPSQAKAA